METEKIISPSALNLTCVSARSCPESKIGLIVAVYERRKTVGVYVAGQRRILNFGDGSDIDALVLKWDVFDLTEKNH